MSELQDIFIFTQPARSVKLHIQVLEMSMHLYLKLKSLAALSISCTDAFILWLKCTLGFSSFFGAHFSFYRKQPYGSWGLPIPQHGIMKPTRSRCKCQAECFVYFAKEQLKWGFSAAFTRSRPRRMRLATMVAPSAQKGSATRTPAPWCVDSRMNWPEPSRRDAFLARHTHPTSVLWAGASALIARRLISG